MFDVVTLLDSSMIVAVSVDVIRSVSVTVAVGVQVLGPVDVVGCGEGQGF